MQRVLVIGPGGAGKTTLARRLAEATGLPLVHLDALYWGPGWTPTPPEPWARIVDGVIARPRWIVDGNYSGTLEARLARADTVVFLDLPPWRCIARVVRRRIRHGRSVRPSMAPGCPERLTLEFLHWIWTYRARSRPEVLRRLENGRGQATVHVLRSSAEVESFMRALEPR